MVWILLHEHSRSNREPYWYSVLLGLCSVFWSCTILPCKLVRCLSQCPNLVRYAKVQVNLSSDLPLMSV